jgi:NADPH-dependent 2,4-dienoyl-CoA reductase/sulfur reductase-like enzyme/rhodanese-related sulfurtransferase
MPNTLSSRALDPESAPRILVVGGVAGGASAAARARRMNENARIIIFERDSYVSFANCGLPYYLGGEIQDRDKLLIAKPALFLKRFRIEVRTRNQVTAIDRAAKTITVTDLDADRTYTESYDKLILAPGADPLVPPIPGTEARGVFTLRNLEDTDRIAEAMPNATRVVVVGGGYVGLETAEQFRRKGLDVSLVEMQPQVMPMLDPEMVEPVHRQLEYNGVHLELGNGIASIEERDGVATAAILVDGTRLPADLVLLGVGVRPNTALAEAAGLRLGESRGIATDAHMITSDPDIYAVGDAAEYTFAATDTKMRVPLAGPANRSGRLAGEHAATGTSRPAPSVMGTSVVRVFGTTAGMSGLSLRGARAAGFDANAVHIIANNHAGYYPGAQAMAVKIVFEEGTGRVLGIQAVGGDGVDKRLDIVSTLMHFKGSVHDLAELDLAYAPPFGSAKDPLHMAGFAAQNHLDGLAPVVQPDIDLCPYQALDVREPGEVAALPLAECDQIINIPLDQLRDRLGELDTDKPTVVACRSGLRSYLGTRILLQHGFKEVYNLSGATAMREFAMNRRLPSAYTATPTGLPAPDAIMID